MRYLKIRTIFGTNFETSRTDYENLENSKPNKLNPSRTVESWPERERKEFLVEVQDLAIEYNYSLDFDQIIEQEQAKKNSVEKVSVLIKLFG